MLARRGNNVEDAILLDDDDPEEQDFADLWDSYPPAKATPVPIVAAGVNVPCDDDVLAYGEDFKKSVQSLTEPVARHDKEPETAQVILSPKQKHEELSACRTNETCYTNGHVPQSLQAPTTRRFSPSNGKASTPRPHKGASSPKVPPQHDQKATKIVPNSAKAAVFPKQRGDRVPSVASKLPSDAPTSSSNSGKEPKVKKSGSLAQRMNLPDLRVVTNDHGQPMGFAAMPSAKDDPRYATSHAVQDGETTSPVNIAGTANGVPKVVSSVQPQAILVSTPAPKAPPKPRPKKPPTKKLDPPQPTLNILPSNCKRPLSAIGIDELYKPGQVISVAKWAKKLRRLEKKQNRVRDNGRGPKEVQYARGIDPVEDQIEVGNDPEELPDVIDFDDCDVPGSVGTGPVEVQKPKGISPTEVPESAGNSPIEMQDAMDTVPSEVSDYTGSGPPELPDNIDNQAIISNIPLVTEQAPPKEVGRKPHKLDNTPTILEEKVAYSEGLKPGGQQNIGSNVPAVGRKRKVRSEVLTPIAKKPAPEKQTTLEFQPEHKQLLAIEEPLNKPQQQSLTTRPTTAGKGISEATLAAWRAAETESITHTPPYQSAEEQEDDLITVTESIYEYHVHRREWLIDDPEGEANAGEQMLGPYHTLQEANLAAAREIRHPIQLGTLHGIPSSAWDFIFRQDHAGLQTQCAEALGVHVEAEVLRELLAPDERPSFPASAFRITPRVYLVQELSWSSTTTPSPALALISTATPCASAPPLCETITHACCTTLERANRKAAEQWLAAYTGAWSDFHAEGKRKDVVERGLKFDLQEMKEGRECFHREVTFADGAMCKFWVVECEVEGPRN